MLSLEMNQSVIKVDSLTSVSIELISEHQRHICKGLEYFILQDQNHPFLKKRLKKSNFAFII